MGLAAASPLHNQRLAADRLKTPALAPASKLPRTAPPRINPDAANRPFLVPIPRSDSPISPAASIISSSSNSSRPSKLQRSATSPMDLPRPSFFSNRPPSPELSASFDCAFPPFPTPEVARPGTSQSNGRKTPSERAPSRNGDSERRAPSRGGEASRRAKDEDRRLEIAEQEFGPKSPMSNGGENVMQRARTIKSGPFDAPRRRRSRDDQGVPLQPGLRSGSDDRGRPNNPMGDIQRPSTSHSTKTAPHRPARPAEEVLSPGFLSQFSEEPMALPSTFSPSQPPLPIRSQDRSRTFPVERQPEQQRRPSEPANPPSRGRERRPTLTAAAQSMPSKIPQVQPARSRSQSQSRTRLDYRIQDAPPVPHPMVQKQRQEASHTPSESSSSTSSVAHSNGSGPSPVSSAASSLDLISPLTQSKVDDAGMRVQGLNVSNKQPQRPALKSPPRNFARPPPHKEPALMPEPISPPFMQTEPPESPMDPAMRQQQSWARPPPPLRTNTAPMPQSLYPAPAVPKSSGDSYDPYRPASPQPPPLSRSHTNPTQQRAHSPQLPPMPREPTLPFQQISMKPTRQPTRKLAPCRGCHLPIEGKSVKAADGRLTGRWHKECFVCKACHKPFQTADFYVINDQPYCEQHYHEANGSLCNGCNLGIEGQYLETTSGSHGSPLAGGRKFHPHCFTCHDCRSVLRDDYFEISGKVYCERHALAAMRGQARIGGLSSATPRAERRTTKLMMM